jgi:hypothetical protein
VRRRLRADLAELVDVAGPRHAGVPARAADAGRASFDGDLRAIRRRIVRRWALAVAVRCALLALAVALVPAALAALGVIGWIWAVVVPVALFVVALALRLARPPSLARVARLLDDRLGLFDVTATALEVERSGAAVDEGPAAPVFAEAAALLRAGASAWRPRARLGGRELALGGGLVVALAVLVAVGSSSGAGGSGSSGATALAPRPGAHRRERGAESVSPPLVPPRAKRAGARKGAGNRRFHPYGIYDYGYEGKRREPHYAQKSKQGLRYANGAPTSKGSQSQFSAPGAAEGNEAREKAEAEAAKAAAQEGAQGKREAAPPSPRQSLKSLTGGAAPPSGSVTPLPNANSAAKPSAGGRPGGKPSSSSAPGARSDSEAPGRQGGGRPSGSKTAGSQRAPLASGERGREGGDTAGELSLKAGFAAVKSGKAATGRGPRDAQGAGGPGRAAGIGGAAFEEAGAGALGYVPPDAGVAPTLDPGLFNRYLNALAAIAGRHW